MTDRRRPLSREQRDLLRGQVDQARRKAEARQKGSPTAPADAVEAISALLLASPAKTFSRSEIGRELECPDNRVRIALYALEAQGHVTTVQGRRGPRWKAKDHPVH